MKIKKSPTKKKLEQEPYVPLPKDDKEMEKHIAEKLQKAARGKSNFFLEIIYDSAEERKARS